MFEVTNDGWGTYEYSLGSTVDQTEAASRGIFFGMRIVVVLQRVLQPKLF
jgi:hypothetical protein